MLMGLIALGIALIFWSIVGAAFLRMSLRWVTKLEVDFGTAFGTMMIAQIIVGVLGVGLMVLLQAKGLEKWSNTALLPVAFVVQTLVIGSRLSLSILRAVLVTLVMYLIGIVLVGGTIAACYFALRK